MYSEVKYENIINIKKVIKILLILLIILFANTLVLPTYKSSAQTSSIEIPDRNLYITLYNITVPGYPFVSLPLKDRIIIFSNNITLTNYGPFGTRIYVYYPDNESLLDTGVFIPWRVLDVDRYGGYAYLALDGGHYSDRAALGILNIYNYEFRYIDFSPYDWGHGIDVEKNLLAFVAYDKDLNKMILVLYKLPSMTELWRVELSNTGSLDITLSPSGEYVAISTSGPTVSIFYAENGTLASSISLGSAYYSTFTVEWIDNNHIVLGIYSDVWLLEFNSDTLSVAQHLYLSGATVYSIRYVPVGDILVATPGIKIFKINRDGDSVSLEYVNDYLPTASYYYDPIVQGTKVAISDRVNGIVTVLTVTGIVGGELARSHYDVSGYAIVTVIVVLVSLLFLRRFR